MMSFQTFNRLFSALRIFALILLGVATAVATLSSTASKMEIMGLYAVAFIFIAVAFAVKVASGITYKKLLRGNGVDVIALQEGSAQFEVAILYNSLFVIFPLLAAGRLLLPTFEDPAVKVTRDMHRATQQLINYVSQVDRATAGPEQRLDVYVTVTTITADQLPKSKWEALVPKLRARIKASPAAKLAEQGITVVYRFNYKNGSLIGELVFAPIDVK